MDNGLPTCHLSKVRSLGLFIAEAKPLRRRLGGWKPIGSHRLPRRDRWVTLLNYADPNARNGRSVGFCR